MDARTAGLGDRSTTAVYGSGGSGPGTCGPADSTRMGDVLDGDLAVALAKAQAGDEAGFVLLWRALQPALLRYLRVVAADAADDVASETWLQVSRDLSGFRGDAAAFRVWVFRIARNRGIDDRRLVYRRREDLRDRVRADPVTRDVALDVVDNLGTDWAIRVITSLPPDQAEAVMLRVVAGLDVAQTAQVLGKRAGAVRVATMRGLRRLAEHPQVRARLSDPDRVPGPASWAPRTSPDGV
jgi:RNA polymerase sigma-70 factor, ECF subfamily